MVVWDYLQIKFWNIDTESKNIKNSKKNFDIVSWLNAIIAEFGWIIDPLKTKIELKFLYHNN